MNISQHVSLKDHSTMRLGGEASYLVSITTKAELEEALAWAAERGVQIMMIGDGSNIVWRDEGFDGLVLVNQLKGFDIKDDGDDVLVTVAAGENWDSVVERTVKAGLTGIEALSLVPGTAGATPVQNVGAYGQEIAQTLVSVEAYDNQASEYITLPNAACGFGYRTSRFKTDDRGRYFITGLTLKLRRGNPEPPFYKALQTYLAEQEITSYTPQTIRDAVTAIRSSKLPDPAKVANNGSFFANPILDEAQFNGLKQANPDLPSWPAGDQLVKIPAAWLVEHAGFKNKHDSETGMATWPMQPLVLVNENAHHTAQLLQFKQQIVDAVQDKFGITLEQEPELLP